MSLSAAVVRNMVAAAAVAPSAAGVLARFGGIRPASWVLAVQAAGVGNVVAGCVAFIVARSSLLRAATAVTITGWVWLLLASRRHARARFAAMQGDVPTVTLSGSVSPVGPVAQLCVVAANLLWENGRHIEAAERLAGVGADVLVTIETTPAALSALEAVFSGTYRPVASVGSEVAIVVWVKSTVHAAPVPTPLPLPVVEIDWAGVTVRVVGVHLQSPKTPSAAQLWRSQLEDLGGWLGRQSVAVVAAGDFNAALEHREMAPVCAVACDAARVSGRWWSRTWPSHRSVSTPLSIPLLGLDHVMVAGPLDVCWYRELRVPGSDHRAVSAGVRPRRCR